MGGRLAAKGPVMKTFQLGDRMFTEEVFLAVIEEALIGAEILQKHEAIVNMKTGEVVFNTQVNLEESNKDSLMYADPCTNLEELVSRNQDLMEGIGKCDIIEHHIPTNGQVVHVRNRRLPVHQLKKVEEHIQEMLKEDIIEECASAFCSPILPLKKKDGSMRMAMDFRELNKVTIKDSFPMTRIDEILEAVAKAKIFSRIDLRKGYYQVPVAKEDRHKTAFQFKGKL